MEEAHSGAGASLRANSDLGSRQVPDAELVDATRRPGRARHHPRGAAAVRIREVVQAHDQRRRVRGKGHPTDLADALRIEKQDVLRLAVSVTDEGAEPRERNG